MTEPYFLDDPLMLSGDIFDQKVEIGEKDIEKSGLDLGFGFKVNEYRNRFGYRYINSKTSTDASFTGTSTSGEEGKKIETSLIN